jgi:predicted GIY-YIG superfamily endonuclease
LLVVKARLVVLKPRRQYLHRHHHRRAKRYAAHVSGKGARYARSHPPHCLLAAFEFEDRSSASKGECELKRLSASQKRPLCLKYFPN